MLLSVEAVDPDQLLFYAEAVGNSFLGTLSRDCGGLTVIMVVHGHWLHLLQRLIHHIPIEESVRRYRKAVFKNASVTVYEEKKSHLVMTMENFAPWEFSLTT